MQAFPLHLSMPIVKPFECPIHPIVRTLLELVSVAQSWVVMCTDCERSPATFSASFCSCLKAVGHTALSARVEFLAVGTASIHPAFDRCTANESPFPFVATLACFPIFLPQQFNDDCFDQFSVVRISFVQTVSCLFKNVR